MATRAASTGYGHGGERGASAVLIAIADLVGAIGQGFRARNEYMALVGKGLDPAKAVATAVRRSTIDV